MISPLYRLPNGNTRYLVAVVGQRQRRNSKISQSWIDNGSFQSPEFKLHSEILLLSRSSQVDFVYFHYLLKWTCFRLLPLLLDGFEAKAHTFLHFGFCNLGRGIWMGWHHFPKRNCHDNRPKCRLHCDSWIYHRKVHLQALIFFILS